MQETQTTGQTVPDKVRNVHDR